MKNKKLEANLSMAVSKVFSGLNMNALKYLLPLWMSPLTGATLRCTFAAAAFWVEIRNWKKQGKLWVADVPMFNGRPLDFRQLWINGQKAVRARDVADFEKMYSMVANEDSY